MKKPDHCSSKMLVPIYLPNNKCFISKQTLF